MQSAKRQCSKRDVTSSNVSSSASSATQSWSSRIPGVSITSAPPGSWTSSPRTVVCLPWASLRSYCLAPPRRVPARAVAAELLRLEQLVARERVDQGRLADAGGAEKRGRDARSEVRANRVEALARDARERVDGDVGGDRPDRDERCGRIVREVALRQQHHRLGAALARQDE